MIPALRFDFLTPFYDKLNRFAYPEKRVKRRLLDIANLQNGDRILDVGCGTGTLILMACQSKSIEAVGIDADPKILALANQKLKSRRANSSIQLSKAMANKLPLASESFDIVFSSLVFHHLDSSEKTAALREIHRVLRAGSAFYLADWGKPQNLIMRLAFLFVQFLDGFECTRDNVMGKIPYMMKEVGFANVEQVDSYSTLVGTLRIHQGRKS